MAKECVSSFAFQMVQNFQDESCFILSTLKGNALRWWCVNWSRLGAEWMWGPAGTQESLRKGLSGLSLRKKQAPMGSSLDPVAFCAGRLALWVTGSTVHLVSLVWGHEPAEWEAQEPAQVELSKRCQRKFQTRTRHGLP